jgi:LmbE family N-acetylglucosaminyl deacetylase
VPPHRPSALLLWEADEADHFEDVSGFVDAKLEALLAHRSQFRSTMRIEAPTSRDETARFRDRVIQRHADEGRRAGFGAAEAFKLMSDI